MSEEAAKTLEIPGWMIMGIILIVIIGLLIFTPLGDTMKDAIINLFGGF
jgi:hypothetical protein